MSRRKKTPQNAFPSTSAESEPVAPSAKWERASQRVRRKDFVVSGAVDEAARIVISGDAYAELLSHAKATLEEEVCGVLVGECFEDDEGLWMNAQAAIRGTSARQGGQHVTYTQEAWEKIYEVKDRDYPKMSIVGWYHTHPGFGVEFSDMDLFIQQNFFSGPAQFALVLDPLAGDEAICVNGPEGIRNVRRFWVDGKPRRCWAPADPAREEASAGVGPGVEKQLDEIESRLNQMMQAAEEERTRHSRFVTAVGMLVAFAAVLWICNSVVSTLFRPYSTPPKMNNWVPVPIMVEGKTVMLGVGIHQWEVPPELNAALVELERQQRAAVAMQQDASVEAEPEVKDDSGQNAMTSVLLLIVLIAAGAALVIFAVVPTVRGLRQGRGVRRQK